MVEQVLSLCRQMGAGENEEALLRTLAPVVMAGLKRELRPGVAAEECADALLLASALTCMEHLGEMTGEGAVNSFTAGEVTIRRERRGSLAGQGRKLLSPWLRDEGLCVMGVMG